MWATEAGTVTTARPAFYAARPGGWRDWWTILHPPYTAWHLSYVVIGATLAPTHRRRPARRDAARVLPRGRRRRARARRAARPAAAHRHPGRRARRRRASRGSRGALGARRRRRRSRPAPGSLVFMAVGPLLVLGYNLELFGGRLHSDVGFAAAWGAFPVLTAYFVQARAARSSPRSSPRPRPSRSHSRSGRSSTQARLVRRRASRRRER